MVWNRLFMEVVDNEVVRRLKSHIGKEFNSSPSALGAWLKGTIRKVEPGSLTIEFVVRDEMTNTAKTLHGGATAAIIDDIIGMTVECLGRETFFTTINLSIDYLSAAKIGETITATSQIHREGKNIVNASCVITNAAGKTLSKGTSNLILTNFPKLGPGTLS